MTDHIKQEYITTLLIAVILLSGCQSLSSDPENGTISPAPVPTDSPITISPTDENGSSTIQSLHLNITYVGSVPILLNLSLVDESQSDTHTPTYHSQNYQEIHPPRNSSQKLTTESHTIHYNTTVSLTLGEKPRNLTLLYQVRNNSRDLQSQNWWSTRCQDDNYISSIELRVVNVVKLHGKCTSVS